ncbi:uncharacterized protein CC84DRAFT_1169641 [Paraphaeosphaeria sporulosa]|uniref:Uncharacterized protein n=1 Tax=Paraphaeosphaeria sporulosa TaxID=1460663 RepID=A0A177BU03_9PLEO|nr:uncharacterized protein CC84DRAFT_1169641 [Paraphaeosphaeria sporulosa]OAF98893.1 hypothetical protein CC84DRAFT_1169641 [Paraphaeosphaeria sporulosa]
MHVTTPGTVGDTITRYSRGTGGMFRWATPYEPLPSNTCEIRTDVLGFLGQQVLKCTGSLKSPSQTFTGFADKDVNGNGLHYLFGVQVSNGTALYGEQLLELGLFNGGGCPV